MSGNNPYDQYGANDSDYPDDDDEIEIHPDITDDPRYVDPEDNDAGFHGEWTDDGSNLDGANNFGAPAVPATPKQKKKFPLSAVLIAAVILGVGVVAVNVFGGGDSEDTVAEPSTSAPSDVSSESSTAPWPTEAPGKVIKESGEGDLSSAEGVIQQYNWAYYESLDPEAVAETFDPANGWTIDDIKEPVESNPKDTVAETEITVTDEEGVYDVLLHVKVKDGDDTVNLDFKQKYEITYHDSRFWILNKEDLGRA